MNSSLHVRGGWRELSNMPAVCRVLKSTEHSIEEIQHPYNPLVNTPASFFNHLSAHKYIIVHPLSSKFIPPVFIFYLVWGLKLGVVISRGGGK